MESGNKFCDLCNEIARYGTKEIPKRCHQHREFGSKCLRFGHICYISDCMKPGIAADLKYSRTFYCDIHMPKHSKKVETTQCHCGLIARYGTPGSRIKKTCLTHKKPYHVMIRKKCGVEKCDSNTKPSRDYCDDHDKSWLSDNKPVDLRKKQPRPATFYKRFK